MSDDSEHSRSSRAGETVLVFNLDRRVLSSGLDVSEALAEAVATRRDLVLDLAGVDDVDLAGVELLATARRTLAEQNRVLVLRGVTEELRSVLELTGIQVGGVPRAHLEEHPPTDPGAPGPPR